MTPAWTTSIAQIQTSDFDAAIGAFRQIYGDAVGIVDDDFVWQAEAATFGPVTLIQDVIDTHVQLDVTIARHALLISRASSMHLHGWSGPPTTIHGTRSILASPGNRLSLQVIPGYSASNFTFAPEFLETQFAALTRQTVQGIHFAAELDLSSPIGSLADQICQYLAAQIRAGTSTVPAALAGSLCETLSRTLLCGVPHNHSYLLDKPAPPSSRTVVRLVEEYVDAHAGGPILADDLARLTGASVQSIEAAFRQHRQTTPLAFLRQRRLERARQLLLGDSFIPIAQIAQMAGYLRVEPFLAAYFKTFKESPAETRRLGFLGPTASPRSSQATLLPTPEARLSLLSERERQVCALVAQGRLNKQIADELGISERTVQDHRAHALKKLGVDSTAELAKLWDRSSK